MHFQFIPINIAVQWIIFFIQPSMLSELLERQLELIRIINSNPNNTWVAGLNGSSNKSASLNTSNTINTDHTDSQFSIKINNWHKYFNLFASSTLPSTFDARMKWSARRGKYRCPTIRKVYNHGKCKCGWAISIAAVVSDRMCISSNYKFRHPLSAHYLISCCKKCCSCNGGNVELGWEFVKYKGLVSGGEFKSKIGCQPFFLPPCQKTYECSTRNSKVPRCLEDSCAPIEINTKSFRPNGIGYNTKTLISDYISFPRENSAKIMRDLMDNGPIQVSMHMYEDFRVYTKGIYRHVIGDFEGDHGVKLIGWGTEQGVQYWLLMNSFGSLWGEDGLFKIPVDGTDNTDYGFTVISPIMISNVAQTTLSCTFFICIMQIFIHSC